ncbi:MAG: sulfite exporter TauE/SafE family protein, partial [Christensenellales bacterium]
LLVAYVSRTTDSPGEFRANVCFVFILVDIFRTVLYAATGIFTRAVFLQALALAPFMALGLLFGTLLAKRVRADAVRNFIMALLALSGISLIITNALGLL